MEGRIKNESFGADLFLFCPYSVITFVDRSNPIIYDHRNSVGVSFEELVRTFQRQLDSFAGIRNIIVSLERTFEKAIKR